MTRKRRGLSMTSILVLALVGTITAIVLGAMAVFLQTYQRSLIRSVQTSARQSVAQVGKTVEDYLDDVNSLMELLERKLEDPRQDRDDFFAAFLQIRPDVVAVTTYDAAGGLVDCRSRAAKRTEIYQNLSFDPDKMDDYADGYVSTPHVASIFQGYYPWVVTLVAPLDAPGREEWIALDISFSSISAYLNDVGIGQHGYCFLMDQSGNIIYHPQQQLIYSDLKRENTSLIAGLPDGSNESGSMIYTLTSLENSHWRVVGVSFVEELITESVQEVSRILAASGIGILLAAVIISLVLFRTLSRPMHGLTAAMRQFEQAADNFTYVPVGGAREVRALSDSFGQMVVQIQRLMEQVRAEEVNLRKTELRALQAQMTTPGVRVVNTGQTVNVTLPEGVLFRSASATPWTLHWGLPTDEVADREFGGAGATVTHDVEPGTIRLWCGQDRSAFVDIRVVDPDGMFLGGSLEHGCPTIAALDTAAEGWGNTPLGAALELARGEPRTTAVLGRAPIGYVAAARQAWMLGAQDPTGFPAAALTVAMVQADGSADRFVARPDAVCGA